jgi:hypothetical protein
MRNKQKGGTEDEKSNDKQMLWWIRFQQKSNPTVYRKKRVGRETLF